MQQLDLNIQTDLMSIHLEKRTAYQTTIAVFIMFLCKLTFPQLLINLCLD